MSLPEKPRQSFIERINMNNRGRVEKISYDAGCELVAKMTVTDTFSIAGADLKWGSLDGVSVLVALAAWGETTLFYPFEDRSVLSYYEK